MPNRSGITAEKSAFNQRKKLEMRIFMLKSACNGAFGCCCENGYYYEHSDICHAGSFVLFVQKKRMNFTKKKRNKARFNQPSEYQSSSGGKKSTRNSI